ncbi:uncharacterized protein LOC107462983 [Arachis duranensis]|uniref:Uncharacterized protein LOC107462983 n=1 Tax=Arachis duranensis TaxID=130453 RepID=A0A6P4BBY4_ARADU|nr:uncharacterized protein LOC107462983 [Arachis duranensis]
MAVVSSGVQCEIFVIGSDEDMGELFHCRQSFSEVRINELFAKLEDRVDNSRASTPNPQSTAVGCASTSMPVVAPRCLLPAAPPVLASAERSPGLITGLVGVGPSSSESHQQPQHFSTLNPESVSQQPDDRHTFGYQGLHEGNASAEFVIGQSFQTKEEAVMSVKDYSIRRGVQYRVMESDHLKYVGRCKEFGNGYNWIIRGAFRQRKGN